MHQNPICETKVPDPQRNKRVCVCVRTLRLRARVKPMWQHKDRLISSSLSVPFLPLCCLTTYSLSSNVRALCSPAQSSASSDSTDLWPPHPDIPATQAHTAHSIWHFSCMEKKKPTKHHALCVWGKHKQGFSVQATSPLITYSSAWMYSRVHMRALLCCIIPFMRLPRPYGKQKEYISKPRGEILLRYTVRALFSVHTAPYYLREPVCCHYPHRFYLRWKSESLTFPKCSAKFWATSLKHPDSGILSLFIPTSLWDPEIVHI